MCGGCLVQQVEKGVFVRGVVVCVVCCVCCLLCVGCLVVLRARVAHTLTHVGTVDDGRPQYVNLPHPLCLCSVCCLRCVWGGVWWWWWCVWVLCGGCCVVGG